MSPHPRRCPRCQVKPVAHQKAVYCLDCRPYHRWPPPPCRRCGSLDYYTSGLRVRCHKYAPALPSSCPHCWSWGLFKNSGGICLACKHWRARDPRLGRCGSCGHDSALNPDGWCRLCYRRARALARADAGDEQDTRRAEAVAGGHQLFLANLEHALALKMPGRRRQIQTHRKDVLFGLRSIFRVLKGRKLTFINPTAGIRSSRLSGRTPLPVQVCELRDALDPANPVRAALAALLIFPPLLRCLATLNHPDLDAEPQLDATGGRS